MTVKKEKRILQISRLILIAELRLTQSVVPARQNNLNYQRLTISCPKIHCFFPPPESIIERWEEQFQSLRA